MQYISKPYDDILLKVELWYHLAFEHFIPNTSVLIQMYQNTYSYMDTQHYKHFQYTVLMAASGKGDLHLDCFW